MKRLLLFALLVGCGGSQVEDSVRSGVQDVALGEEAEVAPATPNTPKPPPPPEPERKPTSDINPVEDVDQLPPPPPPQPAPDSRPDAGVVPVEDYPPYGDPAQICQNAELLMNYEMGCAMTQSPEYCRCRLIFWAMRYDCSTIINAGPYSQAHWNQVAQECPAGM